MFFKIYIYETLQSFSGRQNLPVGVISQTCSMNMSGKNISWFRGPIKRFFFRGKNLTPWGSVEGGTFPRHVNQNFRKLIARKEKRCLPKVVEMCEVSAWMEKVDNFPIWKNQKIFFQNLMNWNIYSWGNFFDKSEKFSLFQLFPKIRNFILPGL